MWPICQPNKSTDAVSITMLTLKADHLAAVELLYKESEQKFTECSLRLVRYRNVHRENQIFALAGHIFIPVNPSSDVELNRLEHEQWLAKTKRDELLFERAELRKSLGLSS